MPKTHGWDDQAIAGYEANKANKSLQMEIDAFRDAADGLRQRYSALPDDASVGIGATKEYAVDYENLVLANAHLADHVPEIAEHLDAMND